jgi:hypothetical protein
MDANIVQQWEFIVGRCDNFWCGRIGLLEVIYHQGFPAATVCVGDCEEGWEERCLSDDEPCLCETNAEGFINKYNPQCPWPGHPQYARRDSAKKLIDSARIGSYTSRLIIEALKKAEREGNEEAKLLMNEMRNYVRQTTGRKG